MRPYSPEAHRRVAEYQRKQLDPVKRGGFGGLMTAIRSWRSTRHENVDRADYDPHLADDRRIIRRSWWSRIVMWWRS